MSAGGSGYMGFSNLPNQVHRKFVRKGFEFTLLVVGESGLGKSTIINSLFQVNIIPIISKADTLTHDEIRTLKKRILDDVEKFEIQIYPLPDCEEDEDESYREHCRKLKEAVPFAVVGSTQTIEIKGKKVRGRMYPWGVVEIENEAHCDFVKLRSVLITHMQDLQEVTHEVHYENYRAKMLPTMGASMVAPIGGGDVLNEKEKELMKKENELKKMQEMVAQMQLQLQAKGADPNAVLHNV